MPYRIDVPCPGDVALDRLVELGALDLESSPDGGMAALMPDSTTPGQVAEALGVAFTVSPAVSRDAGSVWVLRPRPVRAGVLRIVPAHLEAGPGELRLVDAAAFGTGLHPTTALCLDALDELVRIALPAAVLDVGTGSGVLALGALMLGVPRAVALDLDEGALRVAAENARINGLAERLELARGGPDIVIGTWPLVFANLLAAPLVDLAPVLVRRVAHRGHLVLSGIPSSLEAEVARAYRHCGMHRDQVRARDGWAALVLRASW